MNKLYSRIDWKNEPNTTTPLNEVNLNKMDSALNEIDNRIIEQETSKLDKSIAYTMVKDISFNENNGVFTITRLNGSTFTIDTRLEKIAINFKYDYSTQKLIVTLIDGTTQSIDMSALLTQYEFTDSATLDFTTDSNGKVTATIKNGSITEDMLRPNYLAEIKVETEKSAQSMANAKISENNAKQSELNAKASEEQALEYSNNAQPLAQSVSGNNPTAENSTDGNLIYLKDSGYTEQKVEKYLTEFSSSGDFLRTNKIPCKKGDTVAFTSTIEYDSIYMFIYNGETEITSLADVNVNKLEVTIPSSDATHVVFEIEVGGIVGGNGATTNTNTVTVNGSEYTQPSPDNPIRIGGLADKGYFDGVLLQGFRNTAGELAIGSYNNLVTSANFISCNVNDEITIEYEETITRSDETSKPFAITFFDNDKKFVSQMLSDNGTNGMSAIAPNNAKYFVFDVRQDTELLPSTAKHISVTINGMYALRVKTQNKNLCPTFEKSVGANASYYTDSFSVKGDSTYTISFIKERISGSTISNNNLYGYAKVSEYDEKMNLLGTVSGTVASLPSGIHKFVNQITTKPQTKHIAIDFNNNNGESALNTKVYNVQVERGTVATPYEPHQESEALIPVSAPFYEGDYIEVYADGTGREYRKFKKVVLTSDMTIAKSTTGGAKAVTIIMPDSVKSNYISTTSGGRKAYSNIAVSCNNWTEAMTTEGKFALSSDGYFGFYYDGTVDEFKALLDSTEVYIIYELATPTSTPLTAEQVSEFMKLRTYKGVTHVTADGEVTMRYYCDNASGETVSMLQGMVEETKEDLEDLTVTVEQNREDIMDRLGELEGTVDEIPRNPFATFINQDLNTLLSQGKIYNILLPTNAPSGFGGGLLFVGQYGSPSDGKVSQYLIDLSDGKRYLRTWNRGTFSEWAEV